ncbi:hypothetical protein AB9K34_13375 [Sedimentitalea sp. XS_ASV28]|uniref:hypothetical protein n=1 Tax=Sedimentitalea sp. XS_ASV28 TaxID=3241296 RepID=UPI0035164AB7
MTRSDCHLLATRLLDFDTSTVSGLIRDRGSEKLARQERIGAVYEFARNEIGFGDNRAGDIPASEVLAEGIGQCNIKETLLMALRRDPLYRLAHGHWTSARFRRIRSGHVPRIPGMALPNHIQKETQSAT